MHCMRVEIGGKIREVFDTKGITVAKFAEQLGTVRQNVHRIFKKTDLDTALLRKISEVLDHNFFKYYDPPTAEKHENELERYRKEVEYLRRLVEQITEKANGLLVERGPIRTGEAEE